MFKPLYSNSITIYCEKNILQFRKILQPRLTRVRVVALLKIIDYKCLSNVNKMLKSRLKRVVFSFDKNQCLSNSFVKNFRDLSSTNDA